ncbi:MAG: helix-turn-helix domain-containing protein [Actinomycetota bacterium]
MPAPIAPEELEARLTSVRRAAMELFAARGYRSTSMAAIAEATGLSRPALYQHFENREDIFRSALAEILTTSNAEALAALNGLGDLADRFDGYLQRCRGDVIGPLLGSAHGEELIEARSSSANDVADRAHAERHEALLAALSRLTDDETLTRRVAQLLELGSLGLKQDSPTPDEYRERLRSLAEAAASLID